MTTATWNGGFGLYGEPENWDMGAVPGVGDTATISSGKALAASEDIPTTVLLGATDPDVAPVLDLLVASAIQAMNQECPSALEAPCRTKGDLMAVLSANLRLMVSNGRAAAAPILYLAVATLDPDGPLPCQAQVLGWPGAKQGAALVRDLAAAFERQQAAALLATYRFARSVLAEGRTKREMRYETWHGERVLQQRFHATP